MNKLLVFSDEPSLAATLASELANFEVIPHMLASIDTIELTQEFWLAIIDDPGGSHKFRDKNPLPVIITARPIRLKDLLYTIRGRLQSKNGSARQEILFSTHYILAPAERLIRSQDGGKRIALTEKEVEILQCLLMHKGPVSREALLKQVWGYNHDITTHTLETHMYRLRGKLKQAADLTDSIVSDETGYRLNLAT